MGVFFHSYCFHFDYSTPFPFHCEIQKYKNQIWTIHMSRVMKRHNWTGAVTTTQEKKQKNNTTKWNSKTTKQPSQIRLYHVKAFRKCERLKTLEWKRARLNRIRRCYTKALHRVYFYLTLDFNAFRLCERSRARHRITQRMGVAFSSLCVCFTDS